MGLSPDNYSSMLNTAVEAAQCAGQKAMELLDQVSYSLKKQVEIVTQADPLCQALIIDHIRRRYPKHGILAEEGPSEGMLLQPPTDKSDIWWIIDPIDGTNNYAHGMRCFCVSIGVFQNGTPVAAVIYDPCTQLMWTAAKGIPTHFNGKPASVSTESICKFSSFGIDSHYDSATEPAIHELLRLTRARILGSTALHQAYIASGSLIGSFTISAKLWDIAAGTFLIQQAGGMVTTLDRKPVFPIDIANYKAELFRLLSANTIAYDEMAKIFETAAQNSRL